MKQRDTNQNFEDTTKAVLKRKGYGDKCLL